ILRVAKVSDVALEFGLQRTIELRPIQGIPAALRGKNLAERFVPPDEPLSCFGFMEDTVTNTIDERTSHVVVIEGTVKRRSPQKLPELVSGAGLDAPAIFLKGAWPGARGGLHSLLPESLQRFCKQTAQGQNSEARNHYVLSSVIGKA